MRFDGRVAIVTGAGSGLGRAYALALARRGARLVVNNRRRPDGSNPAEDVASEIAALGSEAITDDHSVEKPGAGAAMVEAAIRRWGRLDILICNAGVAGPVGPLHLADMAEMGRAMEVNLFGTIDPLCAALPTMLDRDYGRIILTASSAGFFGARERAHYGAAKGAMLGLARSVAHDTRRSGVNINVISPYAVTGMSGSRDILRGMADIMSPDRVAQVVAWLSHDTCQSSGQVYAAGAGRVRRVTVVETPALAFDVQDIENLSARMVGLDGALELRHSHDSAVALVPELAADSDGHF